MPAYNPPPQVLFSPVSNFYQGKAIRQGLAAGEQDAELRGLQIKATKQEIADAPSNREAAKQKALLQEENIRSQIDTRIRDGEREELEMNAKLLTPLLEDYSSEEDEDKALLKFNENIKTTMSSMSKGSQEKYLEMAGEDHSFSHDEVMTTGLGVRSFMEADKVSPTSLQKELQPLVDRNVISQEQMDEMVLGSNKTGSEPKLDAKGIEIERYKNTLGLSEEDATKLAYNQYTVKPNPVSGTVQVVDTVGGIVREIQVDRPDTPRPSPKKGETLWDLSTYATGPTNTVAAAVSVPLSWVGLSPAEKIIGARQTFATTNQDFVRALQNNKKYPIGEREAITKEISMTPSFLDDPKVMRSKMISLRKSLTIRAEQAEADAMDPANTAKFRGGAKIASSDIRNYLALLGEPSAPDGAISLLMSDPSPEAKAEFEAMFGYLPDDM